jgi:hypothetical protein
MACKLKKSGFLTQAALARKLGVSGPAVSQAVSSGRLVAYNGRGERVQPGYGGRKWLKTAEAAEDWDNNRLRIDDFALDPRESFSAALGNALKGIPSWSGDLFAAAQAGGIAAHSALLQAKFEDLVLVIINLMAAAEADLADAD